jgi:hypothetical protein
MGGEASERQCRDVLETLKIQVGNFDLNYLCQWAKELKVSDLLKRALSEVAE